MENSKNGTVVLQLEMPKDFCELIADRVVEQLSLKANSPGRTNEDHTSKLSTGEEVEKFFRITKSTLRKWREQGKIPYLEVNGYYHYDLKKIMKAILS